jgi:hypothetical protein
MAGFLGLSFSAGLDQARAAVPLIAMAAIRPMTANKPGLRRRKSTADKADQRQNDQGKASKRKHRAGSWPAGP